VANLAEYLMRKQARLGNSDLRSLEVVTGDPEFKEIEAEVRAALDGRREPV